MQVPIAQPPKFRLIIEMSCMSNNDEWVVYVDRLLTREEHLPITITPRFGISWDEPKFVLCRPVYEIEVKDGLIIKGKPEELYESEKPESTLLIDGIYRFAERIRWETLIATKLRNGEMRSPTEIIRDIASSSYYDCMSGGMPIYLMSILRYLIETTPGIDLDKPVYPGKGDWDKKNEERLARNEEMKEEDYEGWFTLRDFYEDAKKSPDLKRKAPEILGIASNQLLLPAKE